MTDNKHYLSWKSKITDDNPKTIPVRSFYVKRYKYELLFEVGSYDMSEKKLEALKFILDNNFNCFLENMFKLEKE